MTDSLFHLSDVAVFIFWVAMAMLFYVYLGYPFLLAIVALFCQHPEQELGCCPTISVLIAARNEQAEIGRKIEETLASDYLAENLEVVVPSDASTDQTDSIVTRCRDT